MELLPILGLLGLLFVKEAGVPIPVPGDFLVLGAGVVAAGATAAAAATSGLLGAPLELAAILLVGFAGGSIQFLLVRGTLRKPFVAMLARFGVAQERLDRLADWLRRRGARGVAIARATPGLRVGAICASGIAGLPFPTFLWGLIAGNTVFVGGHFALGYVVGARALDLIRGLGGAVAGVAAFVALAAAGAVAWTALRRRRATTGATSSSGPEMAVDLPGAGAWAEASCPACLVVALVSPRLTPR